MTPDSAFRLLAERSHDVIYRIRLVPTFGVDYVSPSVAALAGHAPAEYYADPTLWARIIHPDDLAFVDFGALDRFAIEAPVVLRWVLPDGSAIWAEHRSVPVFDANGKVVAIEGSARDVTERVARERELRASEERFRGFLSSIDLGALMLDATGVVTFINDRLLGMLGRSRAEMMGKDWISTAIPEAARDALRAAFLAAMATGRFEGHREDGIVTKAGEVRRLDWTSYIERDVHGVVTGLASVAHDVTDARRIEAERALLAAAVDQAAESIMLTEADGRIAYVNAAFERSSGYARDEVIGRNPRLLKSGTQSATFYDAMWAALSNGMPWVADLVNRRKDGSLYSQVSVISPVRGAGGAVTNFVSVARDVTHERELETQAEALARERQLISETLSRIEPRDTPEATAALFCRQVRSLADVSLATIVAFEPMDTAIPLAYASASGELSLRRLPRSRGRYLRERAGVGPWIEGWVPQPGHPYAQDLAGIGLEAFAYAPIHDGTTLVGVLAVGSSEHHAVAQLTGQLPAILEFAALAGALIGPAIANRHAASTVRAELDAIIAERAFDPVFQPIVDLRHDRVVGYEALTRFRDGAPPDRRFADAVAIGAGLELEVATLEAAVEAACALPAARWLDVNVSPELITTTGHLRRILARRPRRVVLEVTEHVAVPDYQAFRDGIARIGRPVRVAVDDAGAGFASLRHILELRPAFVKLDISLVRHIDTDPAKTALVAGMRHFARATGSRLIAEGVETSGEAAALLALEIRLAQGFLFGRPASAADVLATHG